MVVKRTNWIGAPLGKNKPYNVFKTDRRNIPVNMFKDSDGDGVMNVFDCKPYNPKQQGFIDAVVGAVKGVFSGGSGSIKKGWQEGMAKPSVGQRFTKFTKRFERRVNSGDLSAKTFESKAKRYAKKVYPHFRNQYTSEQAKERFSQGMSRLKKYVSWKSIPGLSEVIRPQKLVEYQTKIPTKWEVINGKEVPTAYKLVTKKKYVANPYGQQMQEYRQRIVEGKLKPMEIRRIMAQKKLARLLVPSLPASTTTATYEYQSKKGEIKGRGRPKGSLDPRYAAYGGVFGYRKYLSEQRKAFQAQLQQQQEMLRMQKYGSQIPQELQNVQGLTTEYSQFEATAPQQVVPQSQIPRETSYPAQPVVEQMQFRPPIATVFKSSGGHPYPAVDSRPLTPANTYSDMIEDVDMMSGRRFFRPKPKPERWSTGG